MAHKALEHLAEPKPTVRDAMRFRELAGATLAGGEAGLDRPIEWVRLMETPEIIPRTGDLLLTTGFPIEDASFHLLAHAGGSGDPHRKETIQHHGTPQRVLFDPQIQRMLREIEARRGPIKVPALPHVGMSRERLIAPILAANQVLGYISVLDSPPHSEELAFLALEPAALVLAP